MQDIQLPQTVRIGRTDYAVNPPGWRLPEDFYGQHDFDEATIVVDPNKRPMIVAETYLHEILHAVWDAAALTGGEGEEVVISSISPVLMCLLRDNPNVLDPVHEAIGIGRREALMERATRGNF